MASIIKEKSRQARRNGAVLKSAAQYCEEIVVVSANREKYVVKQAKRKESASPKMYLENAFYNGIFLGALSREL